MKIRLIRYFPYFLFFYHLLFACIAYDYVNRNNGDAVQYWFVGKNLNAIRWSDFLGPGTDAVKLITYPLVVFLKMPPLLGCVLFSMLSGYGFIRLWNLAKNTGNQHKYLPVVSALILLLPNAHFWTSLIGKESLLFLPMVLLTEMIYKEKYYSVVGFISLLIIAWIRPHLAFVIVLALVIVLFWQGNLNRKAKTLWLAAGFLAVTGLCFLLQKLTHAQESLFLKIQNLYAAHNL